MTILGDQVPAPIRQSSHGHHGQLFMTAMLPSFLCACGGSSGESDSSGEAEPVQPPALDNAKAYIDDGPYSSVLVECIAVRTSEDSCQLTVLPLLGMVVDSPEIQSVMERVGA